MFLSQLFVILLIIVGCFWKILLSKTCDDSTVWMGTLCSAAGYILQSPRLRFVKLFKKLCLQIVGRSIRDKQVITYSQLAQNWNISTKFDEIYFFLSTFANTLRCYEKEIDNLEFVQVIYFEFKESLNNNVTNTC